MRLAAVCAALLLALAARAAEPPVPRAFRDLPAERGQYRMEVLEGHRDGVPMASNRPLMFVCTDNLLRGAHLGGGQEARGQCRFDVAKDTDDEAVVGIDCPQLKGRLVATRVDAKTIVMQSDVSSARGHSLMKLRYTHLGACRPGQAEVTFDPKSQACDEIRTIAASIDPQAACAQRAEPRAECEARAVAAREKLAAMCR